MMSPLQYAQLRKQRQITDALIKIIFGFLGLIAILSLWSILSPSAIKMAQPTNTTSTIQATELVDCQLVICEAGDRPADYYRSSTSARQHIKLENWRRDFAQLNDLKNENLIQPGVSYKMPFGTEIDLKLLEARRRWRRGY